MFDRDRLQGDLERLSSAADSADDLTTELRELGLHFLVETREDQGLDDVRAAFRRVSVRFEVRPLFDPKALGLPDGGCTPCPLVGRHHVATLTGLAIDDWSQSPFDLAAELREAEGFVSVDPDIPIVLPADAEDPELEGEVMEPGEIDFAWALNEMRVGQAWRAMTRRPGEGMLIGHPDTGWAEHVEWGPDQRRGLDPDRGYNFLENEKDSRDRFIRRGHFARPGHGMVTACLMVCRGGLKEDGSGTTPPGRVTGVAPHAVNIPLRCINSVFVVRGTEVLTAILYATELRCHVISLSLGGLKYFFHPWFHSAVKWAVENHCLVMAAAGHTVPGKFIVDPAGYPECLAVAAVERDGVFWEDCSRELPNRPERLDIATPGVGIALATRSQHDEPRDLYRVSKGTSFATAHLAGVAAAWRSEHFADGYDGEVSLQYVFREHLRRTARRPGTGWKPEYGPGIVDLEQLIKTPPPTESETPVAGGRDDDLVRSLATALEAESLDEVGALLGEVLLGSSGPVASEALTLALEVCGSEIAHLVHADDALRNELASLLPVFSGEDGEERATAAVRARALLSAAGSRSLGGTLADAATRSYS
ncbi:MAG: S8/S53 family peptidase [Acidobacteriota bacterium]